MPSNARACEGAEGTHALRALFLTHTFSLTHAPDFAWVNWIKLSFPFFDFVHGKCDGIFFPEMSHSETSPRAFSPCFLAASPWLEQNILRMRMRTKSITGKEKRFPVCSKVILGGKWVEHVGIFAGIQILNLYL